MPPVDVPARRAITGFAVVAPQPGAQRLVYGETTLLTAEPGEQIWVGQRSEGLLVRLGVRECHLATIDGGQPHLTEPFAAGLAPREDPLERDALFFRGATPPRVAWFRREGESMVEVPLPELPGGPAPVFVPGTPVEGPSWMLSNGCTLALNGAPVMLLDVYDAAWIRIDEGEFPLVATGSLEYRGLALHARVRLPEGENPWTATSAELEVDRGGVVRRERVEISCPLD